MVDKNKTGDHHWIRSYITPVPNFPNDGVVFQWYANLLQDPQAFRRVINLLADRYRTRPPDRIACLDARGFIFGSALAYELQVPLILIRKRGKLPREIKQIEYKLEYAKTAMEIECDAVKNKDKILVVDDVLATGGTAKAACQLIHDLGGKVIEFACVIELLPLLGRNSVPQDVYSLVAI